MEKFIYKKKEDNRDISCRLYGRCGKKEELKDSSRISLFGLDCLNKHKLKAS